MMEKSSVLKRLTTPESNASQKVEELEKSVANVTLENEIFKKEVAELSKTIEPFRASYRLRHPHLNMQRAQLINQRP